MTGRDGIAPLAIMNLGQSIAYPLARFFESFMSIGQVPCEWKSAIVKKGLSSDCSNYRPVSVRCAIQKIMERIIVVEILNIMSSVKNSMAFCHLLETTNDWTVSLKNKHMITAIFDCTKAFDVVSHPKLFHKLSAYGIGGNLLTWIRQLLTDRTQNTRVGNSLSESVQLGSGVVQGSCLGPLLFLFMLSMLHP